MAEANIYYPTLSRTRHTRSRLQLQLNMIMRCSYIGSAASYLPGRTKDLSNINTGIMIVQPRCAPQK